MFDNNSREKSQGPNYDIFVSQSLLHKYLKLLVADTHETEQIAPSKKKFQHTETFCNIGCKSNHHCAGSKLIIFNEGLLLSTMEQLYLFLTG